MYLSYIVSFSLSPTSPPILFKKVNGKNILRRGLTKNKHHIIHIIWDRASHCAACCAPAQDQHVWTSAYSAAPSAYAVCRAVLNICEADLWTRSLSFLRGFGGSMARLHPTPD